MTYGGAPYGGAAYGASGSAPGPLLEMSAETDLILAPRIADSDLFVDRQDLLTGIGSVAAVNLSNASLETGEPNPAGASKTVWLEFTEGEGGLRRLIAAGIDSGVSLVVFRYAGVSLYEPTVTTLTQVASAATGDLTFTASAGETYFVQVGLKSGPGTGVTVSLLDGEPGEGTQFGYPTEDTGDSGWIDVTAENAATTWTAWTAPDPAPSGITFQVISDSSAFTATVYTGSTEAALTQVATASGTSDTPLEVSFAPTAGTVYRVRTSGTAGATYSIAWYPPPALVEPEEPGRYVRVEVFEQDGTTRIAELPRRYGVTFTERLNTPGMGSVTVHLSDAVVDAYPQMFKFGNVVKFSIGPKYVSGFIVKERVTTLVSDDEYVGWALQVSGPTLLFLLDDFMVHHDGPTRQDSLDVRYYSWASMPGQWYNPDQWDHLYAATAFDDPPGGDYSPRVPAKKRARFGHPKKWPDKTAMWMTPAAAVEARAYYGLPPLRKRPGSRVHRYYRKNFRVEKNGTKVRFYASADENFEVYLDGETILESQEVEVGYRRFVYTTVRLSAGIHTIAAHVRADGGTKNADGVDAFLFTGMTLNNAGDPDEVLIQSDGKWKAWIGSNPPGWNRAEVLLNTVREARARGVESAQRLKLGFDKDRDAEGQKWTDRFNQEVQIGTSALDLQTQLSEGHGFDVHVQPDDLELKAWRRRGKDKSASVTLEPGRNLLSWEITETDEIRNSFLVRFEDGWTTSRAPNSKKKFGTREAYVELGGVKDGNDARRTMRNVIRGSERERTRAGTPQVLRKRTAALRGGVIPKHGAYPFLDWNVGDVIKVPNNKGVLVRQRCLGLTAVEDEDGNLSFDPEFEVMD